jgi:hypothetical protein
MNALAVIGSRNFSSYNILKEKLDNLDFDMLISGGANGADKLTEKYAKENGLPILIFYPDWKNLGKSAGFIRNEKIIKNSTQVVAFWDGVSKGTKHGIELAKKYNKKVIIEKF